MEIWWINLSAHTFRTKSHYTPKKRPNHCQKKFCAKMLHHRSMPSRLALTIAVTCLKQTYVGKAYCFASTNNCYRLRLLVPVRQIGAAAERRFIRHYKVIEQRGNKSLARYQRQLPDSRYSCFANRQPHSPNAYLQRCKPWYIYYSQSLCP